MMNSTILYQVVLVVKCLCMVFLPVVCSALYLFFLLILKKDMVTAKKQNQCSILHMVLFHGMIFTTLPCLKQMAYKMVVGFLPMAITLHVLQELILKLFARLK